MAVELENKFSMDDALVIGMVPLTINSESPEETLNAYTALYIREEVQMEGLVAQHLRAWISYGGDLCNLYFWRTKSGNELDFVLYGKDTFYAIILNP